MIDLAHGGQMRKRLVQRGVEVVPERPAHVGKGVQADAVEVCRLHPTESVLDQVARDKDVLLVQVRHVAGEPALGNVAPSRGWRVRIEQIVKLVCGPAMVRQRAVQPVGRGRIGDPLHTVDAKAIQHEGIVTRIRQIKDQFVSGACLRSR